MDTIEFKIVTKEYYHYNLECDLVDIFVNGKNLLDTVRDFEISIGHEDGGDYCQVMPERLYIDLIDSYKEDSIFIYDCICACDGCNPFCVYIDVGEKVVTWYDFMTSEEYFDDLCKENNFAMFKERIKNKSGLPPLVFDKKQYFNAICVLRDWVLDNNFSINYAGIECGYLELIFKTPTESYKFVFDELLSDPIPQLVELFNYIQRCIKFDNEHRERGISIGYEFETNLLDTYDDRKIALKISVKHYDLRNILNFEIPDKKISFTHTHLCVEWLEMFKKLFSNLLNDKDFPYSYPCFWYLGEDQGDGIYDTITDEIEAAHPNWTNGEILNYAVKEGKLELSQRHKIYLNHYKRMLTEYKIPKKWFE